MSVVIAFEETGPWRKRLTIEVPAPAVDAETGRVIKELGRGLRLPGFRKGKVPAHLIRQRFPEEVDQRVAQVLVPRYLKQAQAEKNLDPMSPPQVEDVQVEIGKPMTFVAVVETRPEITLGDLDSFDLPALETEVHDEEVDEAMLQLRREHATWEEVDRGAGNGDLVVGTVLDLGEEDAEPQPMRVIVGTEGADEQMSLVLTGMKAGQDSTFDRPGEGDEGPTSYRVEVSSVSEEKLPDLDEDFAKRMGPFEDVESLQAELRKHVERKKEQESRQRRERALLEQLRERHPLDLPEGAVDAEAERMLRDYAGSLQRQGVDLKSVPIDWEGIQGKLRPEAAHRVHERLLLEAVAKEREIRLDEQEFEAMLTGIAAQQRKSSLQVRQEMAEMGRLPALRSSLLQRQALRSLLGEETADLPGEDEKNLQGEEDPDGENTAGEAGEE